MKRCGSWPPPLGSPRRRYGVVDAASPPSPAPAALPEAEAEGGVLTDNELHEALRQLLAAVEVGSSAAGISTTAVKTEDDGVDKGNDQQEMSLVTDGDTKPPPPLLPEDIDASLAAASIGARELPLQEFPSEAPPVGADPDEPKTVLTCWADARTRGPCWSRSFSTTL